MESFEKRGFLQRFGFLFGIVGIAAVAAVIFVGQSLFKRGGPAQKKTPEVTMIKIVPPATPPPPPPPPPPQPRIQEQKMIEQTPIENEEPKPEEAPAPAAPSLGTNIQGTGGPDAFGLSGNSRGTVLGGSGGARSAASRWGWYAGRVQNTVSDALRKNERTREASFRVEVRVWADLTGRIARAQLAGSTGDTALDEAIQRDVLMGLQLAEPPPDGMPMPIVMRLTARRPN
jgi:outer membrane biosynthesis protein TonB